MIDFHLDVIWTIVISVVIVNLVIIGYGISLAVRGWDEIRAVFRGLRKQAP